MLHAINRSLRAGDYTFPTRLDYLTYYAASGLVYDLDEAAIIAIQRDWHSRGQNGCVFAMHAARKLSAEQWRHEIHCDLADADTLRQRIAAAVADPGNEILSLIFPAIVNPVDVRRLVDIIMAAGCYQATATLDGSPLVTLRYQLGDVASWIIGFAPVQTLPLTRRAPFAELAIRTKPKSGPKHPALNNDPAQAHLADVDLGFIPEVTTRLISKSSRRTASILGGTLARAQTRGAKAKVTYDLSSIA